MPALSVLAGRAVVDIAHGRSTAGRAIVVTGASGIAAAGARRFAAEGASVGIVSRDAAKSEALATSIIAAGGRATGPPRTSATRPRRSRRSRALRGAFGRFDGLFAVAGGSGPEVR